MDILQSITSYARGDKQAIHWWENLCALENDDNFWGVLLSRECDLAVLNATCVQFLLLVINRRLTTRGVPSDVCSHLFGAILNITLTANISLDHESSAQMSLQLSETAAKVLLYSTLSPLDFTSHLKQIVDPEIAYSKPFAVAALMNELSIDAISIDHTRKTILAEASPFMMHAIARLLLIDRKSISLCLVIDCLTHWLQARLLPSLESIVVVHMELQISVLESIVQAVVTSIANDHRILMRFADLCECLLELKSYASGSTDNDSDAVNCLVTGATVLPSDDQTVIFDQIATLFSSQLAPVIGAAVRTCCTDVGEECSHRSIALVRIVIAVAKLLRAEVVAEQHNTFLVGLNNLSMHRELSVSATAFEGILEVFKSIPRAVRFSHGVTSWSNHVFDCIFSRIRRQSVDVANEVDEDDDGEWHRVREQICVDVLEECYLSLRSSLLQKLHDGIIQCLQALPANPRVADDLEAAFFVLRALSHSIAKRALLHGASQSAVNNARKLHVTGDQSSGLEEDAQLTTQYLILIFAATSSIFKTASSVAHVAQHPFLVIEISKVTGSYASWMAKAKITPTLSLTVTMDDLLVGSLELIIAALNCPHCGFAASSALRTICSYSGAKIARQFPGCLDFILDTWARTVCSMQHYFPLTTRDDPMAILVHQQLYAVPGADNGSTGNFSGSYCDDGNPQFDEILEIKKSFVLSLCSVLKHVPEDIFPVKVKMLVDPLVETLQRTAYGDAMGGMDEVFLSSLIECLSLFIRSVGAPQLVKSYDRDRPGSSQIDVSSSIDIAQRHPAIAMISSWGPLFLDIYQRVPTTRIASCVCLLMTSITTFIVPLIREEEFLAQLCEYVWSRHVKPLMALSLDSAIDFIIEFVTIVGPSACQQALKSGSFVSGSDTVLNMIGQQLDLVYASVQNEADLSKRDMWYDLLKNVVGLVPILLLAKPYVSEVFTVALTILQTTSDLTAVRSVILFLRSWFNLSESLLALDSEYDSALRSLMAPQVLSLSNSIFQSVFCTTIAQTAGLCSEILVDAFASLFHATIKYGNAFHIKYSTITPLFNSSMDDLCEQMILTSGSVSKDVYLTFMTTMLSIMQRSGTNQVPSIVSFQDLGSSWWACSQGKLSKDDFTLILGKL